MRMTIFRFCSSLIALILLISSASTYAQVQSSANDLSAILNSLHSMQANFTQTIYDNKHKAIQQSFGKMALVRPGKFRWEISKPIPQIIIANDTRLWIYDPDLEQVTIRALHQAAGETPALLLSHENASLEKDFSIKQLPDAAGIKRFELIPTNKDNMFASMQLGFKQNQIEEMQLQDNLGHTTKIEFQNINTNSNLPATLFNFRPPKGVDVIDETKQK